jgi:iron complex transport system substrate-binding protein
MRRIPGTGRRAAVQGLFLALTIAAPAVAAGPGTEIAPRPEIRDAFGREWVAGETPPRRIVSLSPNLTEMLFALGIDPERIVGVTRYCDYPPAARRLPRVGGIVDPSVEAILRMRPDVVLATRGNPRLILDRLEATGVRVFTLESEAGLEPIGRMMEDLAAILAPDSPSRADSTIKAFRAHAACLREHAAAIPRDGRPSVYYYDPVSPDWTAGPGTHVAEAIAWAGGRNVADDAPVPWPRYSLEALLAHQPDWILLAAPSDTASLAQAKEEMLVRELAGRVGWRGLAALREGRVCVVPADALLRPGPRVLGAVDRIARCLHPDRDGDCGP